MYPELGGACVDTCTLIGPNMAGAMPTNGENTASCRLEGSGCACEFGFAPAVSLAGPYTAANGPLTVEDQLLDYCVSGDELRLGVPSLGRTIARRQ